MKDEKGLWLLTDEESKKLVQVLIDRRGNAGATEEEKDAVLFWGNQTKVNQTVFELVLKGMTSIDVDKDMELRFFAMTWDAAPRRPSALAEEEDAP